MNVNGSIRTSSTLPAGPALVQCSQRRGILATHRVAFCGCFPI